MRLYFRGRRVLSVSRYAGRKVASRRRCALQPDFLARLKKTDRASLLVTTALAAAGLAIGTPVDAAPARAYDWSGFYIGGHVGYGDIDNDGFFASSVDLSFGAGAFLTGGQVGWNFQQDGWLFGVEADISSLDWRDASVREEHYFPDANYLTTLRGRVGWTEDNVLFYVTGGLAYLNAKVTTSSGGRDADQHGNTDSKDVSTYGGVAGVGLEWGLTRNVSLTTEGLYLFFDNHEDLSGLIEGCRPGVEGCLSKKANFFEINDGFEFRLGANWRFGGASDSYGAMGAVASFAGTPGTRYNWSGFYIGPNVGYGSVNVGGVFENDRIIPDTGNPAFLDLKNFHDRGLLGGGQAGFNAQFGSVVLGVEGDIAGVDWDDVFVDRQTPENPAGPAVAASLDLGFLATLRGRVGLAADNWLFYATGGVAFLDGEFENITTSSHKDISATGGAVGGGVEWGVTPNLSLKGEGLYLAFNDSTSLANVRGGVPGDHLDIGDGFVTRIGANWRFGGAQYAGVPGVGYKLGPPPLPGVRYDWRGTYIGAQLGDGGLTTDGIYNAGIIPGETIDLRDVNGLGLVGGGQIGTNWQAGSFVYGIEGDIAGVDWNGSQGEFAHPGQAVKFSSDYLATARGRIGWAPDNLLFYATAGFAFLNAELDNTSNEGGRTKDVGSVGGVAGLGMEWGVTQRLSLKMEGDFLVFDETTSITRLGAEGDRGDFFRIDDGFVARVGANWRFGPLL